MKKVYLKYKNILNLLLVISSLAIFNVVANQIFFRIDFIELCNLVGAEMCGVTVTLS